MKPGNCCSRGVQKVARTLQDLLTIPTPQIIVGQHHNRRAHQIGAENPLATAIKTVAVDQGEHTISHRCVPAGTGRHTHPRSEARPLPGRSVASKLDWQSAAQFAAAQCRKSSGMDRRSGRQ